MNNISRSFLWVLGIEFRDANSLSLLQSVVVFQDRSREIFFVPQCPHCSQLTHRDNGDEERQTQASDRGRRASRRLRTIATRLQRLSLRRVLMETSLATEICSPDLLHPRVSAVWDISGLFCDVHHDWTRAQTVLFLMLTMVNVPSGCHEDWFELLDDNH